jgi:hypothetical protein
VKAGGVEPSRRRDARADRKVTTRVMKIELSRKKEKKKTRSPAGRAPSKFGNLDVAVQT